MHQRELDAAYLSSFVIAIETTAPPPPKAPSIQSAPERTEAPVALATVKASHSWWHPRQSLTTNRGTSVGWVSLTLVLLRDSGERRIQGMRDPRPNDELVRCCRSDPDALEELYRRHVRRLTLYAATRCARPEDVADIVAATFVAAMESAHRFDPARGEVFPWLVGIARNLAADAARKAQREREALARVVGRRSLDPDEILELEDRIDAARQHAELERALKRLSIGDREALWLVGGPLSLSGTQAAQALAMSPAAFRMRLMRARRSLRKAQQRSSQHPRHEFPEEAPL